MCRKQFRYQIFPNTQEFVQRAKSFLLQREVEHNLMLGLCSELLSGSSIYEQPPFHCVIESQNGHVVGAALRTPPHSLILSHFDEVVAIPILVDACLEAGQEIVGVLGKSELSEAFLEAWQSRTNQSFTLKMRQMIHQLNHVIPAHTVKGKLLIAQPSDLEMLECWRSAFEMEVHRKQNGVWFTPIIRNSLKKRLAKRPAYHFLWWDGLHPVSWVCYRPTSDNVVRVGPVYTPPSQRGRGYASALVGAVSQMVLDLGYRNSSLYTDLTNPTSNAIYRRLGYEPICEIRLYETTNI